MTEAVIVIDSGQRILLANPALSRSFELNPEDISGRYYWEVFRDSELNQMIERCLAEQAAFRKEHTILLSDRVFEIQISPVFSSHEFIGAVAVFHDVTAIKESEKMRTEFVANVSHELKTPLTSIMGFVETLKEGAADDPRDRARFLEIIAEHSRKLYEMIESLLLLSKIESGREPLTKESLDLGALLREILEGFEARIKKNKIKVRYEPATDPFLVQGDRKTLLQAFSNLLDNAVKYNKPEGEIMIRAFQEPSWAVVRIQDSGVGIPEADLKRIFERFYRVDKSRSRGSGGTGLGLSIAKHVIERHGGTIESESPEQKGSIFTVKLPNSLEK